MATGAWTTVSSCRLADAGFAAYSDVGSHRQHRFPLTIASATSGVRRVSALTTPTGPICPDHRDDGTLRDPWVVAVQVMWAGQRITATKSCPSGRVEHGAESRLDAIQTLSQLSYSPTPEREYTAAVARRDPGPMRPA